jgi:hypothetical protein
MFSDCVWETRVCTKQLALVNKTKQNKNVLLYMLFLYTSVMQLHSSGRTEKENKVSKDGADILRGTPIISIRNELSESHRFTEQ